MFCFMTLLSEFYVITIYNSLLTWMSIRFFVSKLIIQVSKFYLRLLKKNQLFDWKWMKNSCTQNLVSLILWTAILCTWMIISYDIHISDFVLSVFWAYDGKATFDAIWCSYKNLNDFLFKHKLSWIAKTSFIFLWLLS